MFAIVPPDVRTPKLSGALPASSRAKPTRSPSQRMTSSSTKAPAGPQDQTSTPWLAHWARTSPAIERASGGGVK